MKNVAALALLLMSPWMAGLASAQNAAPWDGFYLGASVGDESTKVCSTATLVGANIDPKSATFSGCSSGGLAGGLQFGENIQIKKLVFGIGADLIFSEAKNDNSTLSLVGPTPPAGTYSLSGKFGPKDFAVISGRIGYGGNLIFPYIRGGAVLAASQSSNLNYAPSGTTAPVASFNGGKNFDSTGWAAGAGAEIGLNGAWSISAEYLHINLGKGSNSVATCSGAAAACSAFVGVSLETTHNTYTANIIRVGINYWFNYWDKP